MFIYIALLSAFGTALQNTLMARYARFGDSLSVSFYRSICLIVSLSPLLLLEDRDTISITSNVLMHIGISGVLSALSYWMFMQSLKYLPVGISTAMRYGLNVLVITIVARFFFQETINDINIFFMMMLVVGGGILSVFRSNFLHLDNTNNYIGGLLVLGSGVLSGLAFSILADSARKGDPYLTGYIREIVIFFAFLVIVILRKKILAISLEPITKKGLMQIFLASSPTLLATGGFTLASTLGPVAIVSAITVSGMLITTILGTLLYKEHLKSIQYIGILLIMIAIICIKLFS